jgi:type IV pilus assembly protein PilA
MVVISIIGVISSIAIPSLQKYVYRAERNEAYINLNGIFKAQKTYQAENGSYGTTFDQIGFEIRGGTMIDPNTIQSKYYTYTLETFDVDGIANANYSAVAAGDLDTSDAMLDIIMIESGLIIKT